MPREDVYLIKNLIDFAGSFRVSPSVVRSSERGAWCTRVGYRGINHGGCRGWGFFSWDQPFAWPRRSPVRGAPLEVHALVLGVTHVWLRVEAGGGEQLWSCLKAFAGPVPSAAVWDGDGCAVAAGGTVGLGMARRLPRSWGPLAAAQPCSALGAFSASSCVSGLACPRWRGKGLAAGTDPALCAPCEAGPS